MRKVLQLKTKSNRHSPLVLKWEIFHSAKEFPTTPRAEKRAVDATDATATSNGKQRTQGTAASLQLKTLNTAGNYFGSVDAA